jgi:hypothetical protein
MEAFPVTMAPTTWTRITLAAFFIAQTSGFGVPPKLDLRDSDVVAACHQIEAAISRESTVYWPGEAV